jgi:hypothetical protein
MNADELKDRTKRFALRVLKLAAALPEALKGTRSEGNWCALALLLELTIAQHVVADRGLSLSRRSALSKKKQTKVRFGWN